MFSTWYPSAIDDHRNARLGYKAYIIAFGYKIMLQGVFELQIIYTAVYTLDLCIPILHMHVLNRQDVSQELRNIFY